MATIALIGADGAGKTTVTRMLERSGLLRFKYLYMGVNTSSSNVALPTSRLADYLKGRTRQGRLPAAAGGGSGKGATRKTNAVWAAGRFANRVAEEWFRQGVSLWYQLRGFTVLYDRHFLFDFAPGIGERTEPLDKRLHRWLLRHVYPRPGLVIFLDAPGEVLFSRKGESTIEELERRRQAVLRLGEGMPGFVRVDATRPLAEVYDEVSRCILRFRGRETADAR
jgi:thymidylate kinase